MFDEIIKREPLTEANADMIRRHFRPIEAQMLELGKIDPSKGAGILGGGRKCVWTTEGKRITISMGVGPSLIGMLSKEIDPAAVNSETQPEEAGVAASGG